MKNLGSDNLEFGSFRLDKANKILRNNGEIVALPLKAVELLCLLVENQNEVVSKTEILDKIWENSFVDEGVLTQNIHKLRKVFEEHGETDLIKTVPRRGYIFSYENAPKAALVIERDISEEVEITPETDPDFAKPRIFRKAVRISAVFLLLFGGIAAYFYLRPKPETKNSQVISISPRRAADSHLRSVAVLPFTISSEAETTFAQSFTNDLTTRLGSLNKFNVKPYFIARNATKIKVNFLVTGKISLELNKFSVRINVRNVEKNTDILTKTFEAQRSGLVQLQDAITNAAANTILETLPPAEKDKLADRLPTNFAAYEMYQKGVEIWRRRQDATVYFQKAVELDANFAKAYTGLASMKIFDPKDKSVVVENLEKSLKIEPDSADANAVIGFIKIFQEYDWAQAETAPKTARETDPDNVNAHHWLAIFYTIHGRFDEAKAEITAAIELDEKNPTLLADLGLIQYFAGENEAALASCQKALDLDAGSAFAQKCLTDLENLLPDKATALNEIAEMERNGAYDLVFLRVSPRYGQIRNEPQYQKLLRKLNFNQ